MANSKKDHLCVQHVPLFTVLERAEQEQIEQLIHYKQFKQGEQLFMPGNPQQLFIVARGEVKVYQLTANGKEQFLRVLTQGEYEGETWLFGNANNNIFGTATTETEVCTLHRTDLQRILKKYPVLAIKLLEKSVAKTVALEKQNRLLMIDRVEDRLAAYLLNMAKAGASDSFTIAMKMKELAAFLGTTPETLSRKFKLLEKVGYIKRQRRQVVLINPQGLGMVVRHY